jgi:hypothetical protein
MRSQDQIQDFRKKIDLYLDNALSFEETTEFENTANTNPKYGKLLQSEVQFRNLLKTKVKRSTCSENLINNIKNNIKL